MEINKSNINEIVNKSNAKPDKDYGQNFLIDPEVASKIVDALDTQKEDKVLEIGPGLGSLTHFLVGKGDITVCDIDERMIFFLKAIYRGLSENDSDDFFERYENLMVSGIHHLCPAGAAESPGKM